MIFPDKVQMLRDQLIDMSTPPVTSKTIGSNPGYLVSPGLPKQRSDYNKKNRSPVSVYDDDDYLVKNPELIFL